MKCWTWQLQLQGFGNRLHLWFLRQWTTLAQVPSRMSFLMKRGNLGYRQGAGQTSVTKCWAIYVVNAEGATHHWWNVEPFLLWFSRFIIPFPCHLQQVYFSAFHNGYIYTMGGQGDGNFCPTDVSRINVKSNSGAFETVATQLPADVFSK